jgi:hypothetical protein
MVYKTPADLISNKIKKRVPHLIRDGAKNGGYFYRKNLRF